MISFKDMFTIDYGKPYYPTIIAARRFFNKYLRGVQVQPILDSAGTLDDAIILTGSKKFQGERLFKTLAFNATVPINTQNPRVFKLLSDS